MIALMALGIGPGAEVITSPFTFIASAEVIVLLGATLVFVDVDPLTCNLDPAQIEARISPSTKAIMPVSLFGQPADMDAINTIAARHGIPVIEDAAQSFGASYKGRRSCALSTIGVTSFFPSKPLGCYGDGGAMFTDEDALALAFREIRVHGQSRRYMHTRIGLGGRMDTLQCAIVLAKWPWFEWEVAERNRIGANYRLQIHKQVAGSCDLAVAEVRQDTTSVHAQYTVLVPERDNLVAQFRDVDVPTAVHYPVPVNEQPAYRALSRGGETPISSWLSKHVLSLPMGPYLKQAEMAEILATLARNAREIVL
jgi:UDP-2-acetamido-2-deoxy-ribo-hexuluronate aminotransferase